MPVTVMVEWLLRPPPERHVHQTWRFSFFWTPGNQPRGSAFFGFSVSSMIAQTADVQANGCLRAARLVSTALRFLGTQCSRQNRMTSGALRAWWGGVSYQRAFSTLGCAELSLAEAINLGARHDVDGVEVRALAGSLDVPAALTAEFGTPPEFARRVRDGRQRVVSLDTSLRLIGGTDGERAAFLKFVPWAEAAEVRWLRVFDGGHAADDMEIAAAVETLEWWGRLRAQHGWQVDVMVETHDSLFTAAKIRRLTDALPHVAVLWDAHHTWKRGGEDPVITWSAIAPRVVHVHVKDSVSRPSGQHPYTYVLPGTGEFPAAPLLARLRHEFSGPVSLEWERLWHPDLPTLDAALTAAAQCRWW